jgi:hypothetical protein
MPTTIPANRTVRSVRCRPSSAGCRESPVVCISTTGLARSAWEAREAGAITATKPRFRHQPHTELLSVDAGHNRRAARVRAHADERLPTGQLIRLRPETLMRREESLSYNWKVFVLKFLRQHLAHVRGRALSAGPFDGTVGMYCSYECEGSIFRSHIPLLDFAEILDLRPVHQKAQNHNTPSTRRDCRRKGVDLKEAFLVVPMGVECERQRSSFRKAARSQHMQHLSEVFIQCPVAPRP